MIGNQSSLKNIEHYFLDSSKKSPRATEHFVETKRSLGEKQISSPTLNRLFSDHGSAELKSNETRLLLSKFQRFYEALQEPTVMSDEDELQIKAKWAKFEATYNSPFLFDEFITKIRR